MFVTDKNGPQDQILTKHKEDRVSFNCICSMEREVSRVRPRHFVGFVCEPCCKRFPLSLLFDRHRTSGHLSQMSACIQRKSGGLKVTRAIAHTCVADFLI